MKKLVFWLSFIFISIFTESLGSGLIDETSETVKFKDLNEEYRIYQKRLTWHQSLQYCSKCFGTFAAFDTKEEAIKVEELIYKISVFSKEYDYQIEPNEWGLDRRYWIGLTDEENESNWMWVKSTTEPGTLAEGITSYNWYIGQPDHGISNVPEHCAGFWNPVYHLDQEKTGVVGGRRERHYLNDYPCDTKLYFICKTSGNPDFEPDAACESYDDIIATTVGGTGVGRSIKRRKPKHSVNAPRSKNDSQSAHLNTNGDMVVKLSNTDSLSQLEPISTEDNYALQKAIITRHGTNIANAYDISQEEDDDGLVTDYAVTTSEKDNIISSEDDDGTRKNSADTNIVGTGGPIKRWQFNSTPDGATGKGGHATTATQTNSDLHSLQINKIVTQPKTGSQPVPINLAPTHADSAAQHTAIIVIAHDRKGVTKAEADYVSEDDGSETDDSVTTSENDYTISDYGNGSSEYSNELDDTEVDRSVMREKLKPTISGSTESTMDTTVTTRLKNDSRSAQLNTNGGIISTLSNTDLLFEPISTTTAQQDNDAQQKAINPRHSHSKTSAHANTISKNKLYSSHDGSETDNVVTISGNDNIISREDFNSTRDDSADATVGPIRSNKRWKIKSGVTRNASDATIKTQSNNFRSGKLNKNGDTENEYGGKIVTQPNTGSQPGIINTTQKYAQNVAQYTAINITEHDRNAITKTEVDYVPENEGLETDDSVTTSENDYTISDYGNDPSEYSNELDGTEVGRFETREKLKSTMGGSTIDATIATRLNNDSRSAHLNANSGIIAPPSNTYSHLEPIYTIQTQSDNDTQQKPTNTIDGTTAGRAHTVSHEHELDTNSSTTISENANDNGTSGGHHMSEDSIHATDTNIIGTGRSMERGKVKSTAKITSTKPDNDSLHPELAENSASLENDNTTSAEDDTSANEDLNEANDAGNEFPMKRLKFKSFAGGNPQNASYGMNMNATKLPIEFKPQLPIDHSDNASTNHNATLFDNDKMTSEELFNVIMDDGRYAKHGKYNLNANGNPSNKTTDTQVGNKTSLNGRNATKLTTGNSPEEDNEVEPSFGFAGFKEDEKKTTFLKPIRLPADDSPRLRPTKIFKKLDNTNSPVENMFNFRPRKNNKKIFRVIGEDKRKANLVEYYNLAINDTRRK